MKYSIEGHLALLLRSWQTSLTLTKVYPLFIKRSKTKAAQIISVVFKWFTIHFVGYFYFRPGEYEGEGRKVKVAIKSWKKVKCFRFDICWIQRVYRGFPCLKCSHWKVFDKRSYFLEKHLLSSSLQWLIVAINIACFTNNTRIPESNFCPYVNRKWRL